jgi:exopolysaccharide biosynthesis polyprenyl glycosylphosphotransferase
VDGGVRALGLLEEVDARQDVAPEDPGTVGRRQARWTLKGATVAADMVAIACAMVLAFNVRLLTSDQSAAIARSRHPMILLASIPVWVAIFANYRLYTSRYLVRGVEEFRRLVHAVGAGVIGVALMSYMFKLYVTRGWLVLMFVFGVMLVGLERLVVRQAFNRFRGRGRLLRPVVIVGAGVEGIALCSMLTSEPWHGYDVVGFVDDGEEIGMEIFAGRRLLGRVADTTRIASELKVCGVLVTTTAIGFNAANRLARELTDAGVHVELTSALRDIAAERLLVRPLGGFPLLYIEPVARRGWRPLAKRLTDVVLAGLGLLVAAPALVIIGLAVKLSSRGPVLFVQERVGKDGRPFRLYKFRTMIADAEARLDDLRIHNDAEGPLFKMREDPRVTRVGRFLRKYSLDEVPQCWNVVRGDMSLVGPRPALGSEMGGWSDELHGRLRVKPGLTGMWQVLGRSNSSFEDYVRLDLFYVDNWSLLIDVAIMAKTVPAVVLRRGAY